VALFDVARYSLIASDVIFPPLPLWYEKYGASHADVEVNSPLSRQWLAAAGPIQVIESRE
jgi:hypothetical protein